MLGHFCTVHLPENDMKTTNFKYACFVKTSHLEQRAVGVGCDAAIYLTRCRGSEDLLLGARLLMLYNPPTPKGSIFGSA